MKKLNILLLIVSLLGTQVIKTVDISEAKKTQENKVHRVKINGKTYDCSEINVLGSAWINRETGLAELRQKMADIDKKIKDANFLTKMGYTSAKEHLNSLIKVAANKALQLRRELDNAKEVCGIEMHMVNS